MAASKSLTLKRLLQSTAAHPQAALCDPLLLQALHECCLQLPAFPTRVAVALSGGLDSASLALHLAVWASAHSIPVYSFHVHHGLQAVADQWQQHVGQLALQLGLHVAHQRVHVDLNQGLGMEASARDARYLAFQTMAQRAQLSHVFLAHHLDDQAETVLLRLLRGAGPEGLGAMRPVSERQGVLYLRPWLDVARSRLEPVGIALQQHLGWSPVQDLTNHADDYTRGALRERLTPQLNARWPSWQQVLGRHARLSQQHAVVLQEVAAQDLQTLQPSMKPYGFDLKAWRALSPERQALVLRHWLRAAGVNMPTEARLADWMRQLRSLHALGFDRQMQVKHGEHLLVCRQGRVELISSLIEKNSASAQHKTRNSLE